MKPLNLFSCPLEKPLLIEASAGTGKTYTLSVLVVRLLLEKKHSIKEILITTYTNAACEEIKIRIRNILISLQVILKENNSIKKDAFLDHYKKIILHLNESEKKKHLSLVTQALKDLDDTLIGTIHHIGMHLLSEFSFESGLNLQSPRIEESKQWIEKAIKDFWRHYFYTTKDVDFAHYLMEEAKINSPECLFNFVKNFFLKEYLLLPSLESLKKRKTKSKKNEWFKIWDQFCCYWKKNRKELSKLVSNLRKVEAEKILKEGDEWTQINQIPVNLPKSFENKKLLKLKTKEAFKTHSFFYFLETLQTLILNIKKEHFLKMLFLKHELLIYVKKRIAFFKEKWDWQDYNDPLETLRHSLLTKKNEAITKEIQAKYQVAFIDEFQDTNASQYEIFFHLFGQKKLFLIGDPKQSIFEFQGANIYTYLKAKKEIKLHYTLKKNWRSSKNLLQGLNCLFSEIKNPFKIKEIPFVSLDPSLEISPLIKNGLEETKPIKIHYLLKEENNLSKKIANEKIYQLITHEITKLLKKRSSITFANKALKPNDIAVLVRTNEQILSFKKYFEKANIPYQATTQEDPFKTEEAENLLHFLKSVYDNHKEDLLKGSLAGPFFDYSNEKIKNELENQAILFKTYKQLWKEKGFMAMIKKWIQDSHLRSHLLKTNMGKNKLSNFLTLIEILNLHHFKKKTNALSLLNYFEKKINTKVKTSQDDLLENQKQIYQEGVILSTIHKSKGLEYPMVYCPFLWDKIDPTNKEKAISFYDLKEEKFTYYFDSENNQYQQYKEKEEEQTFHESTRLLYVGMTRAKYQLSIIYGNINKSEKSALFNLLKPYHQKEKEKDEMIEDFFNISLLKQKNPFIEVILENQTLKESPLKESKTNLEYLEKPPALKKIEKKFQIGSFSSWIHGIEEHKLNKEDDQEDPLSPFNEDLENEDSIFSLPKGIFMGKLFHSLLEEWVVLKNEKEIFKKKIKEVCLKKGISKLNEQKIKIILKRATSLYLKSPEENYFSLKDINSKEMVSEMGFIYPLKKANFDFVKKFFLQQEMLKSFRISKGFFKGFIDLVFKKEKRYYLIDWKSNYLGNQFENYENKFLKQAMEKYHYFIQASMYLLALHLYLKNKLQHYDYQKDIGGIYYIFLRGLKEENQKKNQNGIFYFNPGKKIIEILERELIK